MKIVPERLYLVNIDSETYLIARPAAVYVVQPNSANSLTSISLPLNPTNPINPGESFTITNLNTYGLNLVIDSAQGAIHPSNTIGTGSEMIGSIPYLGTVDIRYIGGDTIQYWLIKGDVTSFS
jgi:hypothetical protein